MKLLTAAGALALVVLSALPAFAAVDPNAAVSIPWGDDFLAVAGLVQPFLSVILLGVLTIVGTKLPGPLQAYNTTSNRAAVEQLLEKGVDFALNKVEGAAKGQTLNVNVGSAVLATAAQYAVDHGPTQLIAWAGGADSLMEKILARLNLEPGASGATALANAAVPVAAK